MRAICRPPEGRGVARDAESAGREYDWPFEYLGLRVGKKLGF